MKTITQAFALALALGLMAASVQAEESSALQDGVEAIKNTGKTIGHTTRDVTKKIGHATRDTTTEIGHATRDAAREVGHKTREVTTDIGHATRDAVKDVKEGVTSDK